MSRIMNAYEEALLTLSRLQREAIRNILAHQGDTHGGEVFNEPLTVSALETCQERKAA